MTPTPLAFEAATLEDLAALVALEARCHTHPGPKRPRDRIVPVAGAARSGAARALDAAGRGIAGSMRTALFHVVADEVRPTSPWHPEPAGKGSRAGCSPHPGVVARRAACGPLEVSAGMLPRALYRGHGVREVGDAARVYSARSKTRSCFPTDLDHRTLTGRAKC